ncbi:helix-turn-helix domain-containing protein [Nonomuraea sp. NPDC050394]|uniref:helix-turn-helix domain-containing protein n=1 Tax=Nonomuraea sp. NPDC050394 TaxID=3364363 RepID=UPI00379DB4FD
MPTRISPPLRLEMLGQRLRGLRIERGLTLAEVAQLVSWSTAKVGTLETGRKRVMAGDVHRLLDALGVGADEPIRTECLQLLAAAHQRSWWKDYERVLPVPYVSLETEARLIRTWQPQLIPGLLQTRDYARAVIAAVHPWDEPSTVAMIARARIARQWILGCDDPPDLEVVVGEHALRARLGGPQMMREQLQRLLTAGRERHIAVQVMPAEVHEHAGLMGSFVLLTAPDLPTRLYCEGGPAAIMEEGPHVDQWERRFGVLTQQALTVTESADLIAQIMKETAC